ncbi:hypothetical protein AB6D11_03190 [Vibrio splendidus]
MKLLTRILIPFFIFTIIGCSANKGVPYSDFSSDIAKVSSHDGKLTAKVKDNYQLSIKSVDSSYLTSEHNLHMILKGEFTFVDYGDIETTPVVIDASANINHSQDRDVVYLSNVAVNGIFYPELHQMTVNRIRDNSKAQIQNGLSNSVDYLRLIKPGIVHSWFGTSEELDVEVEFEPERMVFKIK